MKKRITVFAAIMLMLALAGLAFLVAFWFVVAHFVCKFW